MMDLVRMYRGEDTVLVAPWQVEAFMEKGWRLTEEEGRAAAAQEAKAEETDADDAPPSAAARRRARRQAEE